MNLDLAKINGLGSNLAKEIVRMQEERSSWQNALAQGSSLADQIEKLTGGNSLAAEMAMRMKDMSSYSVADQLKLIGGSSGTFQIIQQLQEAQKAQQESIRKMLSPLEDLRKSFLLEQSIQQLIKELSGVSSITQQYKELIGQATGASAFAKAMQVQAEESKEHTRRLLEDLNVGSGVQRYLKEFAEVNKRWAVSSDVLGAVGSLRALQEQIGRVSLPIIDWGSAGVLAKLIGREGIESQLELLGIGPDGALATQPQGPQERGLLSRTEADALALISFLLALLIFFYQEHSSNQWQAQTTAVLQAQAKQIKSLNVLIEKALIQAANQQEERFVVRKRMAIVRSKPESGSSIEGKLLPNEVVRVVDDQGKWIEVEYYHWLQQEYHTGWVLKKYLQRVPSNFKVAANQTR